MADGLETFPVEFRGGLITNLSPIQQGVNIPGSARQLRNFEPSIEGGYRRISGFEKYDDNEITGTGLVRSVFFYNNRVYAVRNNTGVGEGELYESAGSGWTRRSTDSIRFGTGTSKIRVAKYNFDGTERVFMVDGSSAPLYYDGTTIAQLASNSVYDGASHVTVFKDHVFVGNGTKVGFSAPFDATDWSIANGAGEIQFNDEITGLQVFRDQLYVFTRTQIYRIAGNTVSDFQRIPISVDLGCVEEDTIQELAGDVVFMGPDGLRLLSGTDRIGDIGLGAITKNIQSEATDFQRRNTAFTSIVVRKKSQYRILGYKDGDPISEAQGLIGTQFSSQGGEDVAWAETRGIKAYVAYSEYSGQEEVILFANNDGYVYELEQGISFDGAAIESSFFTPYWPVNDPTLRKTVYAVHNYIDPTGSFSAEMGVDYDFNTQIRQDLITLSNAIDDGSLIGLYGESTYATLSGGEPVGEYFIYGEAVRVKLRNQVTGSGFVVSIEYVSNETTQPFTVDAVALEFATESRR